MRPGSAVKPSDCSVATPALDCAPARLVPCAETGLDLKTADKKGRARLGLHIIASHVKDDERWRRLPPSQNLLDELAKTIKAQTPSRYAKKPETCILCATAIQVEEWPCPTHKGMPNNPNTGGSHVPNGELRGPENRKKNCYT
ncbi:hypothetical protein NDU88_005313 [Pleurodeles waltl]|uniref:Uncharacterized protein n=1 Tax=Pleurodeles waltl TaxID=8319 RepID=A0AAV7NM31_PLEWA|nr:hypothetical protein NDU88_005313 [Pleurodeles waltl]